MDWDLAEQLRIAEEIERRKEVERSALRAEINRCELQRDDAEARLQMLTEKVETQEEAHGKFRQLYGNYEEGRGQYAAMLERLGLHREAVRLVAGHEAMIWERVKGSLGEQASGNLESIDQKMVAEIERNLEQMEILRQEIAEWNSRIDCLYGQLWRI